MKKENKLIKSFGINEWGLADLPNKRSGTFISRITIGEDCGCSYCFPHGADTYNDYYSKQQRSWKKQRKEQWKI